jgi:hypothetical protein
LALPDVIHTGFNTVAAHPSTSGIVFASQWTPSGTGLYRSTDGGASWINAGAGVSRVNRLRIDPLGGTLYAAADAGLFRSSDGGTSFANLPSFFGEAVGDVALDPWASSPSTIYTIPKFRDRSYTRSDILMSPDGGATVRLLLVDRYVRPTPRSIAVAGRGTVLLGFMRSVDAFVTRVNTGATGAASLVYSTYLSGSLNDSARSLAVDGSGRAYVAVSTSSPDFPTSIGGSAFGDRLVKINETGSALLFSTRVGDADLPGFANGVALDASGSVYIAGGIDDDFNRILVAKYSPSGNPSVLFRFGGPAWSDIYQSNGPTADANAIAVSPGGTATVTGVARDRWFPTTLDSFQQEFGSGSSDAFVVKIAFDGPNTPPTISSIANSMTAKNTPITIPFTVSDAESGASAVTVSGASSNTALVPNSNLSFAGSGATRTLTITPAANQVGSTTITVTASDGSLTSTGSFSLSVEADVPVPADYDGDGAVDVAIYRPATGTWKIMRSSTGYADTTLEYTPVRSIPVPGDYDGDGRADIAVYQPSIGEWWIRTARAPSMVSTVSWGLSIDVPVPGDYDGDGKTDPAVYRPSTGGWYVLKSSTGYTSSLAFSWGLSTDIPVPGDYDGDGRTDPAVFRRSTGGWYVLQSSTGYTTSTGTSWGLSTDIPIPRDYDGDGRIDPAIYRPSNGLWAILKSTTNYTTSTVVSWGLSTDDPASSDYDADRKSDPAIYRSSTRSWYVLSSKTGYTTSFGVSMPPP